MPPLVNKLRAFLALLTIAGLFAASWLPEFHEAEGFIAPNYCLLIALSVGALALIFSWRTPLQQSGVWFAYLVAAQGITLQLINAGSKIHFQHYRVIQGMSAPYDIVLLAFLGLLTIAVVQGIRPHAVAVTDWIRTHLGLPRVLMLMGALVVFGAFPSREIHNYFLELLFFAWVMAIQLACLVFGLMSVPPAKMNDWSTRVSGFLNRPGKQGKGIERLMLVCVTWVLLVAVLLATFSYERHPHSGDEFAYIYQANYFSEGRLDTPVPPVPEAVEGHFVDCNSERCISAVPPGWAVMLSVGAFFDAHWLVNPILAGINVILLFLMLDWLYDRYTARLGILLLSVSPWYLLMSMSFMNHIFSLSCALTAALSVAGMFRHRSALWGIPGGLAISMLALTRPLEGLMVGCTLLLVALSLPGWRFKLISAATLSFTSLIGGVVTLYYNQAMTGDSFRFPIMAYTDRTLGVGANALGFGPGKGVSWNGVDAFPGHGLADVAVNALLNTVAMNIELFGWGIGSLLVIVLLCMHRGLGWLQRVDRWMLFFIAVVFGFQSLYWFSGAMSFGARYYFLAIVPLIALTAQAVRHFETSPESPVSGLNRTGIMLAAIVVLSTSAMTTFLPWRAIDKFHHSRDMRPDIRYLIADGDLDSVLLLVSGKTHPDLISALVYSNTDPYGNGPLVAWDKSPSVRQRLLEAYPDRQVFLIDGPSLTGAGYRVTAGPVSARELLR